MPNKKEPSKKITPKKAAPKKAVKKAPVKRKLKPEEVEIELKPYRQQAVATVSTTTTTTIEAPKKADSDVKRMIKYGLIWLVAFAVPLIINSVGNNLLENSPVLACCITIPLFIIATKKTFDVVPKHYIWPVALAIGYGILLSAP